ncbi:MAG: hypothetical protein IPN06_08550 [Burkholderiales bacterium]|nr:hypothetical protein [Burkholderiales bacterium]
MSLGKTSMSTGMKLAWGIAKITGISILLVSSVVLKVIWAVVGGNKK